MSENRFRLEEATIADLHAAIQAGQTTCVEIVQGYIDRVRAYNGVPSVLVTEDGGDIPEAAGTVRGGDPIKFPTETAPASDIFPDLDKYRGKPLEFGRMEPTASDPTVQQQYGMIVAKRKAGQVNALATLNIRGERSVTCKGDFDRHPSQGPLPPGAPPVVRALPPIPRRPGTGGGTGRPVREQPGPGSHAHVRRNLFLQRPLRHQGTCAPPAAAMRPTT